MLFNTVVGNSLNPRLFAFASCAPDWAARNGIAIRTTSTIASVSGAIYLDEYGGDGNAEGWKEEGGDEGRVRSTAEFRSGE